MAEEVPEADRSWAAGWQDHEAAQLRRLARLPLWQKLQWLEEMNRIIRHLRTQTPAPSSGERSDNGGAGTRGEEHA